MDGSWPRVGWRRPGRSSRVLDDGDSFRRDRRLDLGYRALCAIGTVLTWALVAIHPPGYDPRSPDPPWTNYAIIATRRPNLKPNLSGLLR